MVSKKWLLTYFGKVIVECGNQTNDNIVTKVSIRNYFLLRDITFTLNVEVDDIDCTHNHIVFLASNARQLFLLNINNFHFFKLFLDNPELLVNVGFQRERICNLVVKRLLQVTVTLVPELEHIENMFENATKIVNSMTSNSSLNSKVNMSTSAMTVPMFLISCTDSNCYLVNNYHCAVDEDDGSKPSLYRIFTEHSNDKVKIMQSVCNKVCQMTSGKDHTLLLTVTGKVYSFGSGNHGELGNGTLNSEQEPVLVMDTLEGLHVSSVTSGSWYSAVLTVDGDIYVWGWNRRNQFGNSELGILNIPYPVDFSHSIDDFEQFQFVYAFRDALFVKSSDGKLLILGDPEYKCNNK